MKNITRFLTFIYLVSTALFSQSNVNGVVFFNHSTELVENGTNAFNLKRAYLSYTNVVSEDVSYQVTYDMGENSSGGSHTALLKVAMVQWKTSLGNLTIGMQGMNMFKTTENTWGHRFIEKTPMDIYNYSASTDLGIGLGRSFGPISTSALITNGGGYKKAETDSHKKISFYTVYGESKLNKNDGYNIGASFSYEPYDQGIIGDFDNDPNTTTPEDSTMISVESARVFGLFGGYSDHKIRVGLEFDKKGIKAQNSQIISSYGTFKVSDKISVLGRIDQYDANTDFEGGSKQSIITGFHYNAGDGIRIAPAFMMMIPEDGDAEKSFVVNFQFKF